MGISARPTELTSYSTGWTLPLTEPMMTRAESIGPATLRSLDAIHLAAAAYFEQELTAVVTCDHRLMTGCRDIGIATASPGRT